MKRFPAKTLVIAALAVACAFALAACGGQSSSNSSQSGNKIVVGYAIDNYGEGEGQGFADSTDYQCFVKPTLETLGWEVELKGIAYADIEKSINDGVIDCFWDNYTIQGREDMYIWSDAYRKARPVIVFKRDDGDFEDVRNGDDIASISDLPSNKVVAVKAESVTYANLPSGQKSFVDSLGTLKEYPGLAQCKDALDKGEVDMVLTEGAISSPLFNDYAAYGLIMFDPADANSYGVAFKEGNEDKAKALSEALKEVYASGTLRNNFASYLEELGYDDAVIEYRWSDTYDQTWLLK